MAKYPTFKYIYPPRPENAIPYSDLDSWDNGTMIAELKINGSNTSIYTNGDICKIMGRHNQTLSNFQISKEEIIENLYKPLNLNGNWIVLNGEHLNKSKKCEDNRIFNQKLILFDILVFDSNHLVGKTFDDRIVLLDDLYGQRKSNREYLFGISENIYHIKSHRSEFKKLFDEYTPIDMVEGLVLKKKDSKLELGLTEKNNNKSQVKCRKKTLNYKY